MNNYEYLLEQRVSRLEERLLALESAFRVLLESLKARPATEAAREAEEDWGK